MYNNWCQVPCLCRGRHQECKHSLSASGTRRKIVAMTDSNLRNNLHYIYPYSDCFVTFLSASSCPNHWLALKTLITQLQFLPGQKGLGLRFHTMLSSTWLHVTVHSKTRQHLHLSTSRRTAAGEYEQLSWGQKLGENCTALRWGVSPNNNKIDNSILYKAT